MYLTTLLPSLHFRSSNKVHDLPMLLGIVKLIDNKKFGIVSDGTMPGLKLGNVLEIYSQFAGHDGTEPLVEDVIEVLKFIGVKDIPVFSTRLVGYHTFREKVFPLFASRLKDSLGTRSVGTAVDFLVPIKSRQYSIANCRGDKLELKLIVKHLVYTKTSTNGLSKTNAAGWKSYERQVRLSSKCKLVT